MRKPLFENNDRSTFSTLSAKEWLVAVETLRRHYLMGRSRLAPSGIPEALFRECERERRSGQDPVPALAEMASWLKMGARLEARRDGIFRLMSGKGAVVLLAVSAAFLALAPWGSPSHVIRDITTYSVVLGALTLLFAVALLRRWLGLVLCVPLDPSEWFRRWQRGRYPRGKDPVVMMRRAGRDPLPLVRGMLQTETVARLDDAGRRLDQLEIWLPLWEIWAFWVPSALFLLGPAWGVFEQA